MIKIEEIENSFNFPSRNFVGVDVNGILEEFSKATGQEPYWVKFIYSEKATKFCKVFPLLLTTVHTVKLGNKERFDKEQIGIKELFVDYQPFYTINLLLDKELLPV